MLSHDANSIRPSSQKFPSRKSKQFTDELLQGRRENLFEGPPFPKAEPAKRDWRPPLCSSKGAEGTNLECRKRGFQRDGGLNKFNQRMSEEKGLFPPFSGFPRCSSHPPEKGRINSHLLWRHTSCVCREPLNSHVRTYLIWRHNITNLPKKPLSSHLLWRHTSCVWEIRERFCESGEGVRLPRERG